MPHGAEGSHTCDVFAHKSEEFFCRMTFQRERRAVYGVHVDVGSAKFEPERGAHSGARKPHVRLFPMRRLIKISVHGSDRSQTPLDVRRGHFDALGGALVPCVVLRSR